MKIFLNDYLLRNKPENNMKTMNIPQKTQSVKSENLIPVEEFCAIRNIDISFIQALQQSNLIEIIIRDNKNFFKAGQLSKLAKIVQLHFDLEIC